MGIVELGLLKSGLLGRVWWERVAVSGLLDPVCQFWVDGCVS